MMGLNDFVYLAPRRTAALALAVISWMSAAALPVYSQAESSSQGGLTMEDRVNYQRAIEEVYWRHRIWPKENPQPKPDLKLDEVMPLSDIQANVEDYLLKSRALAVYWQRPITGEQLQAEMDRMARQTKQPTVLKELWAALRNDPYVIAECLARPSLVNRLIRNWYAHDERYHGELRAQVEPELRAYGSAGQMRAMTGKYRELKWAKGESVGATQASPAKEPSHVYRLAAIASESCACVDDTWTATATVEAPSARVSHTAIWTGHEMIVWGGSSNGVLHNTGSRYDPATNTWMATSTEEAPSARVSHTAVWTGVEMIVWGGYDGTSYINTGGRYNPVTDTWMAMSTEEAPRVRSGHTAVWTGKEMIIWSQDGVPGAGGRYDPATDTWAAVSLVNAPRTVGGYSAVWTDKEMIIWGGWAGGTEFLNTGGRYDPATDTWVATNTVNAPIRRADHTAVWTGSEMIIWGGDTVGVTYMSTNTGGRYNPATDTWMGTSTTNAPSPRDFHTAVWTGTEMVVWGGGSLDTLDTGGRYDPATNTWAATSRDNVPSHRRGHTAVGTDTEMIVWGGFYLYFDPVKGDYVRGVLNTGSRYCASAGNPIAVRPFH